MYKLVFIDQKFIMELYARTGSTSILSKATRPYVGLYNAENNWYIPLRSYISPRKPKNAFYLTPFQTNLEHFKNPGLDFQNSLFVPIESVIEIKNTLPTQQSQFILEKLDDIERKFEQYILSIEFIDHHKPAYLQSTVRYFPNGIQQLKRIIAKHKARQPHSLTEDLQAAQAAANKQESLNPQASLKHTRKQ